MKCQNGTVKRSNKEWQTTAVSKLLIVKNTCSFSISIKFVEHCVVSVKRK